MRWLDVVMRLLGGRSAAPGPRDAGAAAAAPVRGPGLDSPRSFVFARELSEVHLLLDNLSTDPDTDLAERAARKPPPPGLPKDWLEKICEIGWVPGGTPAEQARQAALLVKVKDYLNGLSKPASGSTIAFTFLVTQEDNPRRVEAAAVPGATRAALSPSRSLLARTAYPDLIGKARLFRRWMWGMSLILFLWLLFTCASSWYVAYGNAALAELGTAKAALEVARKRVEDGEAGAGREKTKGGDAGNGTSTGGVVAAAPLETVQQEPTAAQPPALVVGYCDRPKLMPPVKTASGATLVQYENVGQMQACEAFQRSRAHVERVQRSLTSWCSFWCSGPAVAPAAAAAGEEAAPAVNDVSFQAASLANIWATAILPVLYGFLGAGAAIIRSLSRKIKEGLLAPRDLVLSLQQLALGAVVGACIGLFVSQPGTASPGATDLIGPVTLSGSAISFIAGFGVDSVFLALETLIRRIFNPPPITSPSRPDGPPAT